MYSSRTGRIAPAAAFALLLCLLAPPASAADVDALLRIALDDGGPGLRWGQSQDEIQQLFGDEAKPANPGNRPWARDLAASLGNCQFIAHLHGSPGDGGLQDIRLEGVAGISDECHARVSDLATRLYAQGPVVSRNRWMTQSRDGVLTGEGVVTTSSWETPTSCARLSWWTGSGASPPSLSLARAGCGPEGRNITAGTPNPADVPARDANSAWESLLRIGLNAPDAAIRWDTPLADVQRRFAASVKSGPLPPFVQIMLAVNDGDCHYDATLSTSSEGVFRSVGMKQTAGPADACRERMVAELSRLYGSRSAELDRSTWTLQRKTGERTSGDIFAATWEARAACVTLAWHEGAGFTGARNVLDMSAVRGCGDELDGGLRPLNLIER